MINQDQFKNGCDEIYTIGYYSGVYSSLKDENVMKSIQLAIIRAFTALWKMRIEQMALILVFDQDFGMIVSHSF